MAICLNIRLFVHLGRVQEQAHKRIREIKACADMLIRSALRVSLAALHALFSVFLTSCKNSLNGLTCIEEDRLPAFSPSLCGYIIGHACFS